MQASLILHTEDFARVQNLLKQQWSCICLHEFNLLGDFVIYFIYLCIEQAILPPVFSAVIKQFNHIWEKGSPDLQSFWTLWTITYQDCNNLQNRCKTINELENIRTKHSIKYKASFNGVCTRKVTPHKKVLCWEKACLYWRRRFK